MMTNTIRRIAVSILALLCLSATLPGHAETPEPDDPLQQSVDAAEEVRDDPAEVAVGHVDLGPKLVAGQWRFLARDDNPSPPVWREPASLVIRVNDTALLTVPEDPAYEFLTLPADRRVHVVPQTQLPSAVWVGWTSQDPALVESLQRGGKLELRGVEGPGELTVFLQNGFDPPTVLWDESEHRDFWVDSNTHTHANWVFTAPGVYRVEVAFVGELNSGEPLDVAATLTFAVGDATTVEPASQSSTPETPSASEQAASPSASASETSQVAAPAPASQGEQPLLLWLGIGGVGLLLLAAAGFVVLRSRAARAAVEADDAQA